MKTHELRIGNYIQVPFGDEEPWVRSVDTINYDSIMTENGRFCFEDQYDFVPLTEEWLMKFGFVKDDNFNYWINLQTHYLEIFFSGNDYYPVFCEIPEFSHQSEQRVGLKSIKYVHQLQNIYFSLTGQELTIK
jgi:hypothetical protein